VNKLIYIAAGVLIVGYWFYSKINVAQRLTIKPLKLIVEPGLFTTNANVQLLLSNETAAGLRVNMLAGKLTDKSGKVYGMFKNNYTIKILPNQSVISSFTVETMTTDLIDLTKTNYKNLILQGTTVVDGLHIPFNISFATLWQ
jgi:hypothetical protein